MKKLSVRLVKSLIGRPEKHRKIIQSLGLRKINDSNILPINDAVKGMVAKTGHMLEVKEIEENA